MPATTNRRTAEHPTEGFRSAFLATKPRRPARVYLPTDYQPLYAYPLVVLFHATGESEEHAARLVPALSRRNYWVVCLRGSVSLGPRADGRPAFGWPEADECVTDLQAALTHATTEFSIHPERVFLAGVGEGAAVALSLGLAFRE